MNKLYITPALLLQSNLVFAAVEDGRWHAGIGDPTFFGWLTVLAYFAAVYCCIKQVGIVKKQGGEARFWVMLAVVLFLLGVNKQLDLQSWFTQSMRDMAHAHGWYQYRRTVQFAFIATLGVGMLLLLISLRLFLANSWRHFKVVWVGIALLCGFIVMRAASFHHFDILISTNILGIRLNVWVELTSILLIIVGTVYHKKFINSLQAHGDIVNDYVEIAHDGDDVRCPSCGLQPKSAGIDGRTFKCRACGFKYTVNVINS
jgi:predicted RNA-binding Zn-ribbon protein involved in translation (DUF1610 family)